jgi:hypothetical protein
MFGTVRNALWLTPVFLGATAISAVASAETSREALAEQETIQANQEKSASVLVADASVLKNDASTSSMPQPSVSNLLASVEASALNQVTSVSQLTDVRPTDWAFQALQSLVERYGCIVGYPDRTYRGNRALSRYEFAAGLNACLDRINELIAASTADLVKKEDLLTLQRLQEEFAAELAGLRGRVDQLEARTATLEKQQFSTTTKLAGEVIFAVADTWGDAATRRGNGTIITPRVNKADNTQAILANRVRLNFDTSFTGKDRLRTRLQAANVTSFSGNLTGTNMTRLSFDGSDNNAVAIDELYYRFPVGDNLRVQIDATNTEFYDALISSNSPFESSGTGAVSRFGRFNPFLRSGNSGAGLTFDLKLGDWANLQAGYIADTSSNVPLPKNGLFNGSYSAIGQLVLRPFKDFSLGLFYNHSYYSGADVNITASTGSEFARRPFGAVATSNDTVGANLQWKIGKGFIFGGWFGYMWANRRSNSDQAQILNAAVFLGFPDLLKKGNLGGLLVGIPPYVVDNDVNREDEDTPIHVEAFYRFRVTNNITVTPGFFAIINPEGNSDNATQFVGTIRTTFSF